MRLFPVLLVGLSGCPWVGLAEHERLQDELLKPDPTDTDVDADADSDTDTDTDADTDTSDTGSTLPDCIDDAFEPNENLITATDAGVLPTSVFATMCPDNVSSTLGVPADLFRATINSNQVLRATVSDGLTDACADHEFIVQVFDSNLDQLYTFERSAGACLSVEAGWGAGDYYVLVSTLPGATDRQDYELTLESELCVDNDSDDWLSSSCGGADCFDASPFVFPGAPETVGNGLDEDCDGGDELLATCPVSSVVSQPVLGTLNCGDTRTAPVWDGWSVFVNPGDTVNVVAGQRRRGGRPRGVRDRRRRNFPPRLRRRFGSARR